MKAIVKNIPIETQLESGGHHDTFVFSMSELIGSTIEVEQKSGTTEWYISIESGDDWFNYHKSWLEFVEE